MIFKKFKFLLLMSIGLFLAGCQSTPMIAEHSDAKQNNIAYAFFGVDYTNKASDDTDFYFEFIIKHDETEQEFSALAKPSRVKKFALFENLPAGAYSWVGVKTKIHRASRSKYERGDEISPLTGTFELKPGDLLNLGFNFHIINTNTPKGYSTSTDLGALEPEQFDIVTKSLFKSHPELESYNMI